MNKEVFKEEIFSDSVIRTNLPLLFERLVRFVFVLICYSLKYLNATWIFE